MKSFQVRETTTVLKTSSKQAIRIRWQVTIVERRNFFARLNIYIYTHVYISCSLKVARWETGQLLANPDAYVHASLSLSRLFLRRGTRVCCCSQLGPRFPRSVLPRLLFSLLPLFPRSTIGEYYSTLRSSESSIRFSTYHDNTRYLWFHSRKCNFSSWRIRERFEKAGSKFNFNWKCILYRYTR